MCSWAEDMSVGGIFGEFDLPLVDGSQAVAAARRHQRVAGILLPAAGEKRKYVDLGFEFLACGTDFSMLAAGARSIIEQLRSEVS